MGDPSAPTSPPGRRDAVRNYHRVLEAAREVLGESGADASMEEIAARAGVGVGTVYRRFANKDALIDELVRLSMADALDAARQALARPGGAGLEQYLRGLGTLFAAHARYAHLLLQRSHWRTGFLDWINPTGSAHTADQPMDGGLSRGGMQIRQT